MIEVNEDIRRQESCSFRRQTGRKPAGRFATVCPTEHDQFHSIFNTVSGHDFNSKVENKSDI